MKIVLLSDTHGDEHLAEAVYLREQGADCYLHLGDSELPPSEIAPFVGVKGNRDHFGGYPLERKIKTPLGFLKATHRPPEPSLLSKEKDIAIYAFGHTHVRMFKKVGNLWLINPGSALLPRDGLAPSYCVLVIEDGKVEAVFKDI